MGAEVWTVCRDTYFVYLVEVDEASCIVIRGLGVLHR